MYISVNEAATKFNLSKRRVQVLCEQGRIHGAHMVGSVWLIPETAPKPTDERRKERNEHPMRFLDMPQKTFTVDEVCQLLSISKATAKNWIRLGKLTPDIGDQFFSQAYLETLLAELQSEDNTKLKRRRNKKSATGKVLCKDYIHTAANQKVVEDLLELGIIQSESDLLLVLANFALQLYDQRHGIPYSKSNALPEFLSQKRQDDFYILIEDLLGKQTVDSASVTRLQPALEKELCFVPGEDSLGFVYISLKDIGQRKSFGTYYTPEKVVNELIARLYDNEDTLKSKTICDPCCGTGNFLLSLGAKGVAYTNLYGQDIDPISVYLSRINIALIAPQMSAANLRSRIIIGNTYFETFEQQFDVILGNPPWGSDFSDEDAARCRSLFKTATGKSLESYGLFVEKALSMLRQHGILAFVLPEAILNVAAHDAIRRWMLNCCSFKFVSYLGNVFSGVQCPSILLGITPDECKTVVGCNVTTSIDTFTIAQERDFEHGVLSLHVSDEENECLRAISSIAHAAYLKGNARFALGIVTGNNKDYISNQKKDGFEVILRGSDILRYGMKPAEHYIQFVPDSFQQVAPTELYRAKEKLLYRFISEVPVFTYDNQQMLSLNSCNVIIPQIPGLEMKYILGILNSSVAAYFISKKFHSIKLLRSHIEQMPIPVVAPDMQAAIIKKVDRIMHSQENSSSLYADLDQDVMELFDLSAGQIQAIQTALAGKNLFLTAH